MRVFLFVNRVVELGSRQTTALLAAAFCRLDQRVVIADVGALSFATSGGSVSFAAVGIELPSDCRTSEQVAEYSAQGRSSAEFRLDATDLIMIRTNPGRDTQRHQIHQNFLHLLMLAANAGIQVVNSPGRLSFFASKASLAMLDGKYRPTMAVLTTVSDVISWVNEAPVECVVKPLMGSRGANVMRVHSRMPNLKAEIEKALTDQPVVVQHFVQAKHPGDRRIVVLDGDVLETAEGIAGIARHPGEKDFRANLHAGGTAHPVWLDENDRDAVQRAAVLLAENGIRLAGVDLIGDQIIEFNVFSTGGLFDANRFAKTDFAEIIAQRVLQ